MFSRAIMATAVVSVLSIPLSAVTGRAPGEAAGATPPSGVVAVSAGGLRVTPQSLAVTVEAGRRQQSAVQLTNVGGSTVRWWIADGEGAASRPGRLGDVQRSWAVTGMAVGWGIGTESGNVWISDVDLLRNDSYTPDGIRRSEGWPTPWANINPGPLDMAYVPSRSLMCQVKTGAENGISCWDPRTGDVRADIVGEFAWTAAPQRGLAYRPDDDSFYVGGWDQGRIYHIRGLGSPRPGSVISSCVPPDRAVAGLGWSAGFDRLWVATQSPRDLIYALDPDTCRTLATVAPPDADPSTGAGLDVGPDGSLWIMSAGVGAPPATSGTASQIGSGLPVFATAPWLAAERSSGSLRPGGSLRIGIRVDATRLAPGRYEATLYVLSDEAQNCLTAVPVRLLVRPAQH
ncbi:BACON domain-containing protein [Actinoplanes awajinensis]|nr:hypothetical protein [Actinoplanes awajinensis]